MARAILSISSDCHRLALSISKSIINRISATPKYKLSKGRLTLNLVLQQVSTENKWRQISISREMQIIPLPLQLINRPASIQMRGELHFRVFGADGSRQPFTSIILPRTFMRMGQMELLSINLLVQSAHTS